MLSNDVTVLRAEQGILASLLQNKALLYERTNQLSATLFTSLLHRQIYSAITALMFDGMEPDSMNVTAKLIQSGSLQEAGGSEYIQMLAGLSYEEQHIESFILMIRYTGLNHMLEELGKEMLTPEPKYTTAEQRWRNVNNKVQQIEKLLFPGSYQQLSSVLDECMQQLDGNYEKSSSSVSTGFQNLDQITGGLGNGQLIILGARPAMGKTAFLLHIVKSICVEKAIPVVYISIEMGAPVIVQRLLSQMSLVPSEKIRTCRLTEDEKKHVQLAGEQLRKAPLHIVDRAGITTEEITRTVRQLKRKHGTALVIIDYLQLINTHRTSRFVSRDIEVSGICRSLKTLARDLDIPVLVSSQLSRALETRGGDKRPILSDLRESGSIEQDADKVMFLYRPEYYGIETDEIGATYPPGILEIIVAKNRFGPLGKAQVFFRAATTSFDTVQKTDQTDEEIEIAGVLDERVRERFMNVFKQLDGNEAIDDNSPF
jgi:replicative DNA helicase